MPGPSSRLVPPHFRIDTSKEADVNIPSTAPYRNAKEQEKDTASRADRIACHPADPPISASPPPFHPLHTPDLVVLRASDAPRLLGPDLPRLSPLSLDPALSIFTRQNAAAAAPTPVDGLSCASHEESLIPVVGSENSFVWGRWH
ncbi:hypothetical protein VDGL01_04681 [Verticillium dahliae]